jgi:hypothetical protein
VGWVRAVSWGILVAILSHRDRCKMGLTYNSQAAGVTDCSCELGVSYPLHSSLDDGHCREIVRNAFTSSVKVSLTCNPQFPGKHRIERHRVAVLTLCSSRIDVCVCRYKNCRYTSKSQDVESDEMK